VSAPSERAGQLRKLPRTQALLRTHTHLGPGSGQLTLKRVSCHAQGGVPTRHSVSTPPWGGGPRPARARAAPRSSPLFAPRPRSTWVSLRTARQVVKPTWRSSGPGLRTRITGQVRVRAMQAGQTRSCGARAHTHKHPRTEMPAVGSHATCAAALPSGSPPPRLPFQRSFGQLKIVNRPTPQTSALFSGPHGLSGSLGTS
jgi:hypothetical protein